MRRADWREEGGVVVVVRRRPEVRGARGLWQWLGYKMTAPRVRLDERGSFAWRALDGGTSVREIAAAMRERFGDEIEPAEERLGHLLRALRREELIEFPGVEPR